MKLRIKEIISWFMFVISCCMILFPSNYKLSDWKFWSVALGIFGLCFVGRYDEHN